MDAARSLAHNRSLTVAVLKTAAGAAVLMLEVRRRDQS
jgi:hypothetical protein